MNAGLAHDMASSGVSAGDLETNPEVLAQLMAVFYRYLPHAPTIKSVSKFAFNISHLKGGALAALGETVRPIKSSFTTPPLSLFLCDTEPPITQPHICPFMMGLGRIWRGINKVCGALLKRVSLAQSAAKTKISSGFPNRKLLHTLFCRDPN